MYLEPNLVQLCFKCNFYPLPNNSCEFLSLVRACAILLAFSRFNFFYFWRRSSSCMHWTTYRGELTPDNERESEKGR